MSDTIAVFIDGDNISPKDIDAILSEIYNYGNIIIKRVYLDWTQTHSQNWLKATHEYGIEPIQCNLIRGKNSTDIKLTVDVMKILYTVPHISLFYLVTQDGDFRHIIPEIKLNNRNVNVIGKNISKALGACCDKYTSIDFISGDKGKTNSTTNDNSKITNSKEILLNYKIDIETLLENNGTLSLSLIKDTLQRKYQFDQREYGYEQFSKFMDNYFPEYIISKRRDGCFISLSDSCENNRIMK